MKEEISSLITPEELMTFRREILHQYPEVSGCEEKTAENVIQFLKPLQPDQLITNLGGHGIAAIFGTSGPLILLRSELDALPIAEINTFEYHSKFPGVSHKCGHDGHSVILCGVAAWLAENRPENGRVLLLFQPAEENGEGAEAVLKDEKFSDINPEYVFALHNLPGFPLHQIVVKEGSFTAAVSSIVVQLKGKTSHAAEPEHGINPALAIAEILLETDKLNVNVQADKNFTVITPVYVKMGEIAHGISAGEGELHLTVRTWTDENLNLAKSKIEAMVKRACERIGINYSTEWIQNFSANNNDVQAVNIIRKAANQNGFELFESPVPFKWGEDFGLFTQKYKGAMFGLGGGQNLPALHNPDYDFPDELLLTGIKQFIAIINECFNE